MFRGLRGCNVAERNAFFVVLLPLTVSKTILTLVGKRVLRHMVFIEQDRLQGQECDDLCDKILLSRDDL